MIKSQTLHIETSIFHYLCSYDSHVHMIHMFIVSEPFLERNTLLHRLCWFLIENEFTYLLPHLVSPDKQLKSSELPIGARWEHH